MQEPTIIEKLKTNPDEDFKNPKTNVLDEGKRKNGLGLILIILLLVVIFPIGVIGYLFSTGQLHLGDNQEEESEIESEVEKEEDNNELKTYQNNEKGLSLKYPSDWVLSYVEEECPQSLNLIGCETPEIYEYVVDLVKDDYIFEISKIKEEYLSSSSSYMVFPDSEFVENYQDCSGWSEYEDYLELNSTYLEGIYRRNVTWFESVYSGYGGFYVGYRDVNLEDSTNLFLSQLPFGSVFYSVPEEYDESILSEMDSIFESIEIVDVDSEDLSESEEVESDQASFENWNSYTFDNMGISVKIPDTFWNVLEREFELGGILDGYYLTFYSLEEEEKEYYLSPWYGSTCVASENVHILYELEFLSSTEYLMVADCLNSEGTVIGRKVYMEYPSTEEIRNLGTVSTDGVHPTTQFVFERSVMEDSNITDEELKEKYLTIKDILESVEEL